MIATNRRCAFARFSLFTPSITNAASISCLISGVRKGLQFFTPQSRWFTLPMISTSVSGINSTVIPTSSQAAKTRPSDSAFFWKPERYSSCTWNFRLIILRWDDLMKGILTMQDRILAHDNVTVNPFDSLPPDEMNCPKFHWRKFANVLRYSKTTGIAEDVL